LKTGISTEIRGNLSGGCIVPTGSAVLLVGSRSMLS
jgi:hypothetical protein